MTFCAQSPLNPSITVSKRFWCLHCLSYTCIVSIALFFNDISKCILYRFQIIFIAGTYCTIQYHVLNETIDIAPTCYQEIMAMNTSDGRDSNSKLRKQH